MDEHIRKFLEMARLPPEYPKPKLVVPDHTVDAYRTEFGEKFEIVPLSETYLPSDSAPEKLG